MITPLNTVVDKYNKTHIPQMYTYEVFLTQAPDGFDEHKLQILYNKFNGRIRARKSSNIEVHLATTELLESMIRTILNKINLKTH